VDVNAQIPLPPFICLSVLGSRFGLPISHAVVLIEDTLRNLLFERVLFHFVFIESDSKSRLRVGRHGSRVFVGSESFIDNIIPPRDFVVHGLSDSETVLETQIERVEFSANKFTLATMYLFLSPKTITLRACPSRPTSKTTLPLN